ncbi:MAG TPA: hypothetical protein VF925_06270 [Casimicrobiaceae bacterium]
MNPLSLVVVIVIVAVALIVAWRRGIARGRRESGGREDPGRTSFSSVEASERIDTAEGKRGTSRVFGSQHADLADERHRLFGELADARAETARYRQIIVDLERNAPPPLLDAPNAPDDLKLIVGVGPALERMLQQLGIFTYRQIAHWSERDIDAFEGRLPEFPGRIRRDAWVTQARALHQSKYGEKP